jgi:hypothetical protein
MKRKNTYIVTIYNRHIRNARKAVKGSQGYDRSMKICEYFENIIGYSETWRLFFKLSSHSERQYAIDLMITLAHSAALNESVNKQS